MKLNYLLFCLLFNGFIGFMPFAQAQVPSIHEIIVRGNKIIDTKAVLAKLSSQTGKRYSSNQVRQDVKSLFHTGWFYDIAVDLKYRTRNSVILTYTVKENPIVEKIIFEGNDHISKKEIDKIFLFSEFEFLNHKKIRQSIESIKEEYKKKGYYFTEVFHTVEKTDHPEKVHLVININEKDKTTVKRIGFTGNHSISSETIKSVINTKESGLLSLLSSSYGSYNKDVLDQDLQIIKFLYMDRGYWQVQVDQPEIFVSPDQTSISINISINEGEQYETGVIAFSGDLIFDSAYLKEDLETEETEILSYGKLQRDMKRIQAKYGDKGFAFTNVIPKFSTTMDNSNIVHILFEIQKGKEVKIGKIHISGNSYTRDKVIRREIRVFENELYHETDKNRSVENIKRLGFFDDVQIMPKTIQNRDDLVDMEVSVKERETTGVFNLGLRYSGYDQLAIVGKIHKLNLFGRGYNVGMDVDLNQIHQNLNVSFSDPYFLDSEWYFGTDLYLNYWNDVSCDEYIEKEQEYRDRLQGEGFPTEKERTSAKHEVDMLNKECVSFLNRPISRGFSIQTIGGAVTLGRSLTDTLRTKFSYGVSHNVLTGRNDVRYEDSTGLRNPSEIIIEYDERNDRILPTQGFYSRGSIAYDGFFGKFNYLTMSANMRFYQELFWNLVFRTNFNYGHHILLDTQGNVPRDRLFRLGGIETLRGFEYWSVGPRQENEVSVNKDNLPRSIANPVLGGMQQFFVNMELQFPILQRPLFMGVLFMDVGSAYNDWSFIDWRSNWGVGIRVVTPVGPIRVEIGFPFAPRKNEGSYNTNFTLGFPF